MSNEPRDHEEKEETHWVFQDRIAKKTFCLSIFTVVGVLLSAVFAFCAFDQARRQAEATSGQLDAIRREQRAYVSAKSLHFVHRDDEQRGEDLIVVWSNSGKTWATNVNAICEVQVIDSANNPQIYKVQVPIIFLAPTADTDAGRVFIPHEQMVSVQNKIKTMNISWSVEYADTMGCRRGTRQAWKLVRLQLDKPWNEVKKQRVYLRLF